MEYLDEHSPYWRKVYKKMQGKPAVVRRLQGRTMNTAMSILDNIKDVDFTKLSMSLYFYCQDIRMNQFTRYYEAQIELAGANPERFFVGLHAFYNNISSKIKKDNLYSQFFELYYRCTRLRQQNENDNIEDHVVVAYLNLLTQNIEYLRPDKFDFSHCVAGMSTRGEILLYKDPFPDIDIPGLEIREIAETGKRYSMEDVFALYRKYGYPVRRFEDIEAITNMDKIQSTTIAAILPLINEYTFDILPKDPFSALAIILDCVRSNMDENEIRERLKQRNKTLPRNGVVVRFHDSSIVKEILLKEILFDNTVFMLYKLSTSTGDLCGYYDTKDAFFYSILNEYKEDPSIIKNLSCLILFCYACFTIVGNTFQIENLKKYFVFFGCDPKVEYYLRGGKLKNTYRDESSEQSGTPRSGNDAYERDDRSIQGYIRRLPAGQKASEEAVAYASSLGYVLEPDETYVRPFIKQVFQLRKVGK